MHVTCTKLRVGEAQLHTTTKSGQVLPVKALAIMGNGQITVRYKCLGAKPLKNEALRNVTALNLVALLNRGVVSDDGPRRTGKAILLFRCIIPAKPI